MLAVAAVFGVEFGLQSLVRVVGDLPDAETTAALDEAIAAGLVRELREQAARFRFTHALIRETISEELG